MLIVKKLSSPILLILLVIKKLLFHFFEILTRSLKILLFAIHSLSE